MKPGFAIGFLALLLCGCRPTTMTGDYTATIWGISFDDVRFYGDQVSLTATYKNAPIQLTGNYKLANDNTLTITITDVQITQANPFVRGQVSDELHNLIPPTLTGDVDIEREGATLTTTPAYSSTVIVFKRKFKD
jgi:hypothetical protein